MILDMGNDKDRPLILVVLSLILQMLAYMWLLGKFNSSLLEGKKYLLLPLDNPSLMRHRKEEASEENQDEETKADWRTGEACQEEEE